MTSLEQLAEAAQGRDPNNANGSEIEEDVIQEQEEKPQITSCLVF